MDLTPKAAPTVGKIILVFGRPGIGKTSLIHGYPKKQVFLELEPTGKEHVPVARLGRNDIASNWKGDLNSTLVHIATEIKKAGFDAISIDTISALEEIAHSAVLKQNGWASLESPGYGKGHTVFREAMAKTVGAMEQIARMGLDVLLLSHAQVETVPEYDGTSRDVLTPKFGSIKAEKAPYREQLIGYCWIVGQIRQNMIVNPETGKTTGSGIVFDCGASPGSAGKTRVKIPTVIGITEGGPEFWKLVEPQL